MVCPSALSFILYNPLRRAFTDRKAILKESGIDDKTIVLEVGAGNGFFTELLVQKAKKVYAVELQAGMVKKLRKRLPSDVGNIEIIQANISEIALPDESIDIAFLYYAFHEFDNKPKSAEIIGRLVKEDGHVCIYEPTVEVNSQKMEQTIQFFEKVGFEREMERKALFTRFARLRKR